MEAYEGQEPYIFISYARVDADKVTPLLEALSSAGYRIWYDAGIQSGADWLEVLLGKVAACEVFCPLFSEAFKDSHYCYEETEWAYQKRKTIVPVYLEELTPDGLRLFYQRLLQSRQTLRLCDCANAAEFVERLGREQAFTLCKAPEWNKIGEIQWRFSETDGVLTIVANEDMRSIHENTLKSVTDSLPFNGSIPAYQYDPLHYCSTAPWMLYWKKIVSVVIGDDIEKIGEDAFLHCKNLIDVHISGSVSKIGDKTFFACENLKSMCLSDSVTEIGQFAFAFCIRITNVRIPDGVTEISDGTFFACLSLTDVRIPDSVIKIGDLAFYGCHSLKSVEIPVRADVAEDTFPEHTRVIRRDGTVVQEGTLQ